MGMRTGFDLSFVCFGGGRGGIPFYFLHFADMLHILRRRRITWAGCPGRWDQGRTGCLLLAFLITYRMVDGVGVFCLGVLSS